MENNYSDTLGAGSYPEPPEEKMQTISGKVVLTYNIEADVPDKWDKEAILSDIKRDLRSYVGLYDYEDIDIDLNWSEEDV